ncbi:hypothetical protein QBC34DRAFT_298791, partial [Podospora aff. communis PSN243]
RGWVFQERILSPRILHFTKGQVYWECRELSCSEDFPTGLPDWGKGLNAIKRKLHSATATAESELLALPADTDGEYRRCRIWMEIVTTYTSRRLTYRSDALAALSGVAKYVQPIMGHAASNYVAGLWKNQDMISQLCWSAAFTLWSRDEPLPSHGKFKPPTWSWSMVGRPVTFDPLRYTGAPKPKGACTILEAEAHHATQDPTGPVNGGCIAIEGQLCRVSLRNRSICQDHDGDMKDLGLGHYWDGPIDLDTHPESLYLFLLQTGWAGPPNNYYYINCLILTPITNQRGSFERRGFAMRADPSEAASAERGLSERKGSGRKVLERTKISGFIILATQRASVATFHIV